MKYKFRKNETFPAVFILEAIVDKHIYDSEPYSGYSILLEVTVWLEESFGIEGVSWMENLINGELMFINEEDAMAFKLYWEESC